MDDDARVAPARVRDDRSSALATMRLVFSALGRYFNLTALGQSTAIPTTLLGSSWGSTHQLSIPRRKNNVRGPDERNSSMSTAGSSSRTCRRQALPPSTMVPTTRNLGAGMLSAAVAGQWLRRSASRRRERGSRISSQCSATTVAGNAANESGSPIPNSCARKL